MSSVDWEQSNSFKECYSALFHVIQLDYEMALEIVKSFQEFIFDTLDSKIIKISAAELPATSNFGASVRTEGKIAFVIGIMAEEKILRDIAEAYEHFQIDSLEEEYDAVSEMLNVFTGHFMIKLAEKFGIEEDLDPPRCGRAKENIGVMKIHVNTGAFYLYVGKEEIFQN